MINEGSTNTVKRIIVGLLAFAVAPVLADTPVNLELVGLSGNDGQVVVSVYDSKKAWLKEPVVREIVDAARARTPGIHVHLDGAQTLGADVLDLRALVVVRKQHGVNGKTIPLALLVAYQLSIKKSVSGQLCRGHTIIGCIHWLSLNVDVKSEND